MNPKRDQIIGEEGSTLRLTTTERRLKPRTSPESQPRLGFTGASKKFCPSSFFSGPARDLNPVICGTLIRSFADLTPVAARPGSGPRRGRRLKSRLLSGSADYNSSPAGIADGPRRSSACEHCWRRHRTMVTGLVRSLRSATANPGPVAAGETNEPGCTDVGPAAARDRPTGK